MNALGSAVIIDYLILVILYIIYIIYNIYNIYNIALLLRYTIKYIGFCIYKC